MAALVVALTVACAGSGVPAQGAVGEGGCTTTVVAGDTALSTAVADAGPGDVVCLSGTFDERLLVVRGGTADAPLVFRSLDPAAPAVLRPAGEVPEGDQGVVEIRDIGHVTIQGLELTDWRTDELGHAPAGIVVSSTGTAAVDGVQLIGNHVHDLGHTHPASFTDEELADCDDAVAECAGDLAFSIQAFGIVVKGRAVAPISGLRIVGNELNDLVLGGSEAMAINGNVGDFEITDNLVHDVNNIAIDAIGSEDLDSYPADVADEDRQARDGLIARNRVWNVSSLGNPAYGQYGDDGTATTFDQSAVGVYIDGGRDIVVEGNVIVGADIGVEVAAEFDFGATRDNVVRSNLIGRTDVAGIALGGYAEENPDDGVPIDEAYNGEGDAIGIQVVHNTVHTAGGSAALVVQYRVTDSVVAGNILAGPDGQVVEGVEEDSLAGIDYAGNLELAVASEGEDPEGIFASADLPGPAELRVGGEALRGFLHLASESAAMDAGTTVTQAGSVLDVGAVDLDGDPRENGTIDLGADEVGGATAGRISGSNRFATAAAIAATDHPAGADVVVLARADEFADALSSAPVAFGAGAPVLVSDTSQLNAETSAAIEALGPTTVILFGGSAALDASVEAALAADRDVERIAGTNRYGTAALAATYLDDHGGLGTDGDGRRVAIVAEAGDPLGPLAAGVPAAVGRFPVLLADPDRLPEETRGALVDHEIDVVELIGSAAQLSDGVRTAIEGLGISVNRVEGPTPLDTVAAVADMGARRGLLTGSGAVLGRGDNVVDTLTAGPHAAARRVPILLAADSSTLGEAARGWFERSPNADGLVEAVGGTAALTDAVLQEAVLAASGR